MEMALIDVRGAFREEASAKNHLTDVVNRLEE